MRRIVPILLLAALLGPPTALSSQVPKAPPRTGGGDGWFAKFMTPYDVPAIAAEFHMAGADDHLQVADAHGETDAHGHAADTHAAADDHGDGHGADAAHGDGHGDGHHDVHHTAHIRAMVMSIIMVVLGIGGAWWVYHRRKVDTIALMNRMKGAYTVLQGMYFFDELYHKTVYPFTLWWASVCAAFDRIVVDGIVNGSGYLTRMMAWVSGLIDKYLVDGAVNGVAAVFQGAGEGFRRIQTGRVQTYLVYASASVLILVLVYRVL